MKSSGPREQKAPPNCRMNYTKAISSSSKFREISEEAVLPKSNRRVQIIERVSQEPRIVGFTHWVTQASSREAERMLDMVGELAEARRVLKNIVTIPL